MQSYIVKVQKISKIHTITCIIYNNPAWFTQIHMRQYNITSAP